MRFFVFLLGVLEFCCAVSFSKNDCLLEIELAKNLSDITIESVEREFPNLIHHTMESASDLGLPIELTPVFYGSYDWHSAVHTFWQMIRLVRVHPTAEYGPRLIERLTESFTEEKLFKEFQYASAPGRTGFERPYGIAWILQIVTELTELQTDTQDPIGTLLITQWLRWMEPLEKDSVLRLTDWLQKLPNPIRIGEHSQTAFSMGLMLDYARAVENREFESLIMQSSLDFHLSDVNCPLHMEPSGHDFFSPCFASADLMRRVLPRDRFGEWLAAALPFIPTDGSANWLIPVEVVDPTDGKLAHFDGLNLSRAWMIDGILSTLAANDPRVSSLQAVHSTHFIAGLAAVEDPDQMDFLSSHWLGSFAVYAASCRGIL